jgi:hypothetical protein
VKIAYVGYLRAFAPDGVNHKVERQVAAWRRAGHTVEIFVLSRRPDDPSAEPVLEGNVYGFGSVPERAVRTLALGRDIRAFDPDVVYARYDRYIPPLPFLVPGRRVVVEINTDDREETRFWGTWHWRYNELNRRLTLPFAAGFVCVTYELAANRNFSRFGRPTVVIANSGDQRNAVELGPNASERPAAVMLIGSVDPWVGIDKAAQLAVALPELDVHLVGCGPQDLNGSARPANLHTHGRLTRAEYRPLMEASDFGIGPLAIHRKGIDEASPLKIREYLLHGLPTLVAHRDTDFLGQEPWFMLRLANDESNLDDVDRIRAWVAAVRGRRVPLDEVIGQIGIDAKEQTRLVFLEALARRPGARAR